MQEINEATGVQAAGRTVGKRLTPLRQAPAPLRNKIIKAALMRVFPLFNQSVF